MLVGPWTVGGRGRYPWNLIQDTSCWGISARTSLASIIWLYWLPADPLTPPKCRCSSLLQREKRWSAAMANIRLTKENEGYTVLIIHTRKSRQYFLYGWLVWEKWDKQQIKETVSIAVLYIWPTTEDEIFKSTVLCLSDTVYPIYSWTLYCLNSEAM